MKVFRTKSETTQFVKHCKSSGKTVGFVPTMGALHQGHVSLIERSKAENGTTGCSIFVNPIQFNNPEDLKKYPRTIETDIQKLEDAGCDFLFYPEVSEMYPEPVEEKYDFGHLDKVLEGKFRPGHFNGVAIVVRKLFEIFLPDKAYFGLKDFQQLRIIQSMTKQLALPVEIVPCATYRESDGLAMSSRNVRLSPDERKLSPVIYQTLLEVKQMAGKIPITEVEDWATQKLNKLDGFNTEYFSIVDAETLLPVVNWSGAKRLVACTAVFVGNVRLIDNLILI